MLNKEGARELAYVVKIDKVEPIPGRDRVESAVVGGWTVMVRKNQFKPGDLGIYFEIDSKCPTKEPFEFLAAKHYKIKTQKYAIKDENGNKLGQYWSQGLLMSFEDFDKNGFQSYMEDNGLTGYMNGKYYHEGDFLTQELGVTYADPDDNARKAKSADKYKKMAQRHGKLFSKPIFKWLMRRTWGKKLLFIFFGNKKKDTAKTWPVGKFPGVARTDQERCENMTWILQDKTPFIVTQKCDGSSGTYIIERKGKNKYEFYVCSRNVRMASKEQECFYGSHNYYWEVAEKYDIENKMKTWLNAAPNRDWICWQGEICAPGIQSNPHKLTETHFYCFHWTDNVNGRMDIRDAAKNWKDLNMEVVPIVNESYILPDDFEEFKASADGYYDASVCEGNSKCKREGYVYYKSTQPTFSFKNVSREYLLNH